MIDTIIEFCKTNVEVITAIGVLIAAVVFIKNEFFGLFAKTTKLELSADAAQALAATATPSVDEPHVMEFLRIRKAMKADLEEEFKEAAEKDKAPLLTRIAELERQIANPDDALKEAQKRIADLEALLDREGNDIGAERIEAAKTAMETGDYSQADDIFAEIEAREEIAVQRAARAAFGRGEVAEAEIRWHDAYTHYKRAAQLHETEDHLESYARMAWKLAQGPEAVEATERLVSLAKETYGDQSPETAVQLNNLANVLQSHQRMGEAEGLYRQALEIGSKTIGEQHPSYALRLNNLANVLEATGRFNEAEDLLRQALEIDANTIGEGHPDYAMHLNNLATVLQVQGNFDEAECLYRQALEIDAKTIGVRHPDFATHLNNLANVLAERGNFPMAREKWQQALEVLEATLPADHPYITGLQSKLDRTAP